MIRRTATDDLFATARRWPRSVRWDSAVTLLSHDSDLDRVAQVTGLELDDVALRA